jgi:type II secretory pathway pseudopilin PulG
MELLVVLLVIAGVALLVRAAARNRERQALERRNAEDLEALRKVADEDVTRFGEELQRLDTDMSAVPLDEAMRQDYQRALDAYEAAKESLRLATRPDHVKHVTEALEDGRYAVACVNARTKGEPLPVRRPPCFFNPAHGPSTTDVEWSPPGGALRKVPVCGADADRVAQGAEPDIRTVPQGVGRVPYWQGGPAYSPWASGYFGGYATSGLLPGFLLGSLLSPGWDGGFADDGGWGVDSGGDGGGDGGGDWGGDAGAGDGGGDGGGDWGGGDFGGGDFGGGDFGGGDFGGF